MRTPCPRCHRRCAGSLVSFAAAVVAVAEAEVEEVIMRLVLVLPLLLVFLLLLLPTYLPASTAPTNATAKPDCPDGADPTLRIMVSNDRGKARITLTEAGIEAKLLCL